MSILSTITAFLSDGSLSGSRSDVILSGAGERIVFPVPVTEFTMQEKNNNSIVNINNVGDINMIGKKALGEIQISSFFPSRAYTFCASNPYKPYGYVSKIKKMATSGSPLRIIMSNTSVNMPCLIESFEYGEKDGTCDVYFTLSLKEYVYLAGQIDDTQINAQTGLKDRPRSTLDRIREVKVYPGDSIMDVVARGVGQNLNYGESSTKLSEFAKIAKTKKVKPGNILGVTGVLFDD